MQKAGLLLFDIDGTILQMKLGLSKGIFARILSEIFGKEMADTGMPGFAGKTDLQIMEEICVNYDIPYSELSDNIEDIWKSMITIFTDYCTPEHIDLLPGSKELIEHFDDDEEYQLGLLTGNFRENAYLKLKAHSLESNFPFGAFGSDNADRNMLPPLAIDRANDMVGSIFFSQSNTLIIGDSERDVECARTNGLPVVCVATGSLGYDELAALNPDLLYESFINYESVAADIRKLLNNRA